SSHPHAQAQVQGWLRENVPGAHIAAASSTAAAARELAAADADEARGRAAVCSPLAAEHFGLTVLADGIDDYDGAITRFVLVTREGRIPARTGADKTTQTMFGSDVLRLSPKQLMADTDCLDEQKLEEVLDPIDETVIIGPPSDCERKSEEVSKEMRMERPKLMEQQGFEMLSASLENESEKVGRRKEEGAEEKKSVSYGGTVVKEMNVCE